MIVLVSVVYKNTAEIVGAISAVPFSSVYARI